MSPFSTFRRHPRGELTPYADGRLGAAEARRVETHLAGCEACRADIETQREVRSLLQQAPIEPSPRSFALTPGMLQEPKRRNIRAEAAPVATGLRLASAGLALALALVVFIDVNQNQDGGGGVSDKQAMATSADSAYSNDSASAPEAAGGVGGPVSGPSALPTPAPTEPGGIAGVGDGEPAPSGTAPPTSESTRNYSADVGEDDSGVADTSTALAQEDGHDGNNLLIVEAALIIALAAALAGSVFVARKARRD